MKRLLMGIATVALVATTAYAQAPFADVPREHWAYDSVNTLAQRGIVIGYPDGTFGGKRAMTRYEFAVAIARMLPQVEQQIKDAVASVNVGPTAAPDLSGYAKTGDLAKFVTKDDFDTLKKLVDQFAPELQMLQVDVAGVRKDLDSLTDRVKKIEDELGRIKITGTADVIARMSATNRDTLRNGDVYKENPYTGFTGQPVDIDGRPVNRTTNLLEMAQVLYNTNINVAARVSKNITANTTWNLGNYAGGFASAQVFPGAPPFDRGAFPYGNVSKGSLSSENSPLRAYISAPVDLPMLGKIDLEAGKTGVQFTPYTLKLVDYDTYTNIDFADNGEVILTGAKAKLNLFGVDLSAYAGTHGTALLTGGPDAYGIFPNGSGYPVLFTGGVYNPTAVYASDSTGAPILTMPEALYGQRYGLRGLPFLYATATQSAGVHASLGTPFGGTLGLTYINAGINNTDLRDTDLPGVKAMDVGRGSVMGANLKMNLIRGIVLNAEYASSDLYERGHKFRVDDNDSVIEGDHAAIDAKLAFNIKALNMTAGYKKIDPFFGAPGSWGAIGGWKNPVNIEGYAGTAGLKLAKGLNFTGSAEAYKSIVAGIGTTANAVLADDDSTEITRWTAGLNFNLSPSNTVNASVETVNTKPNAIINPSGSKAQETYYNLGYGAALSNNASFRLLYQIIDYRDKGANLLNNGQDAKSSVAVGQFTVKF